MKRSILAVITVILAFCAAPEVHARGHLPRVILRFGTNYGVDGPFVGSANPIRGINGDGLPWEVERVEGLLLEDGHLVILVRGLVLKDEDPVPDNLKGINPDATFRAVVSCMTEESEEEVGIANIPTREFPANRAGNSFINTRIKLPNTCVAPIVFITAGTRPVWFSVTGIEREED